MKLALFSSVGYSDNCIDYFLSEMKEHCDLFINYYVDNPEKYYDIKKYAKYSTNRYDTKFPSLKHTFLNSDLSSYDYVFVLDDDCLVETGNLLDIPRIMSQYQLDIASACHSTKGRTSYSIMNNHPGDHIFRHTNFVEMNFPVFSKNALHKYMEAYDGQLCGWGNDWWYLHTLKCNTAKNCAIIDSVCVKNPDHYAKQYLTIDKFMDRDSRRKQWEAIRHQLQLHEWPMQTLGFVYA